MLLVDYYRSAPDIVQFNQYWCPDTTMMDKIKVGWFTENQRRQMYCSFLTSRQHSLHGQILVVRLVTQWVLTLLSVFSVRAP